MRRTPHGKAAGTRAGTYEHGVVLRGVYGGVTKETSAIVHVLPGSLSALTLVPSEVTLNIGASKLFLLRAFDAFGNKISDAAASWSVTPDVGTVDANGVLTTGTLAGA